MPSIKQKIEKDHGRTLTNRQMSFAKFFVEGVVKSLGSRSLFLFRGSEALPLARGGLSEAQGSRFEGLAPCISALRLASLEHYSEVLRLAPCLAPCASMEEGGE
jgi:hypothetical protein